MLVSCVASAVPRRHHLCNPCNPWLKERGGKSSHIIFLSFAKIAATLPPTFRNPCVSDACGWWQQGGRWQQSPTPSPSPIGRGAAAHREVMAGLVTSNDSPNPFTTVKTVFSCGENTVFQRRKRHLPAWWHTHYAQQLPSPRGGVGGGAGWGWGCGPVWALLPLSHHLPPPLLPLCTKGFCGVGGRVAAKTEKKLNLTGRKFFEFVNKCNCS